MGPSMTPTISAWGQILWIDCLSARLHRLRHGTPPLFQLLLHSIIDLIIYENLFTFFQRVSVAITHSFFCSRRYCLSKESS